MIGAIGLRCPECGHTVKAPREFLRTRRNRSVLSCGLVFVALGPGYWAWSHRDAIALAVLPRWKHTGRTNAGAFTIDTFVDRRGGAPQQIRILRSGNLQAMLNGWTLSVRMIADVNGDGTPEIVIHEFTHGAHCCSTDFVFSLSPEDGVKPLATIKGWHGGIIYEDRDGDGLPEVVLNDWTFAYWETSFASSPAPEVILRFRGERLVIADDLMTSAPPTEGALTEWVQDILTNPEYQEGWHYGKPPPEYWSIMLDLIYHGHEAEAWTFAEAAWPAEVPGQDEFLASFKKQLSDSPYWPDVRAVSQAIESRRGNAAYDPAIRDDR